MVFKASLYDINEAIEAKDQKEHPLEKTVSEQYHVFRPLFSKVLAGRLPTHRPGIDHEVRFNDGERPTWGPLYSMSKDELVIFKEWLEENMSTGFIRQSLSPSAASVLIAKKPGGVLWFCIDYGNIDSKTIKNRYPRLLIKDMLDLLENLGYILR
jgi:hypothetical protein